MALGGFVGGFGWFWIVLGGFGWFWVVPCFSNYGGKRQFETDCLEIDFLFNLQKIRLWDCL